MTDDVIPDNVRRFLTAHIDSVAQLEALLLLRADPRQEWGADQAAKRLYIQPGQAESMLAALAEQGLLDARVEHSPVYRYAPRDDDLRQTVDEVADTYRERLVPVTHFIHGKERSPIQRFADAFRLGREK